MVVFEVFASTKLDLNVAKFSSIMHALHAVLEYSSILVPRSVGWDANFPPGRERRSHQVFVLIDGWFNNTYYRISVCGILRVRYSEVNDPNFPI